MTTHNTEPIPVKDALRLCEMAIEDCDKAMPGPWLTTGSLRSVCSDENVAFIVLSRAVMRPMLVGIREPLARLNPTWVTGHTSDMYPILSALRDHYDKTRPSSAQSEGKIK